MQRRSWRLITFSVLGAASVLIALTLMAAPRVRPLPKPPEHRGGGSGGGTSWQACPVPSCMAPCVYPAPPQVLCRDPDGSVAATTYFCCCCGSADGYSFQPLP